MTDKIRPMARRAGTGLALVVTLALGTWLGTAMADRSATAPPIVYSGQVLGPSGAPIADSTTNSVSLSLYDGPDSGADTRLCPVVSSTTVATRGGHFSLPLSATCSNVFETAEEVWVHLTVNGTVIAATRASAVPYAVRAERLVVAAGGEIESVGGVYCGATPSTTGAITSGALTGWRAGRALCETACSSPSAHICTGDELMHAIQIGAGPPSTGTVAHRWYASGAPSIDIGGAYHDDCTGFRSATGGGATWVTGTTGDVGYPAIRSCDQSLPVLCCD